eukprot:SM000009S23471  [mRNA]  locus=s9:217207:217875:+ [translate_table: standard]
MCHHRLQGQQKFGQTVGFTEEGKALVQRVLSQLARPHDLILVVHVIKNVPLPSLGYSLPVADASEQLLASYSKELKNACERLLTPVVKAGLQKQA